MINRKSSIYIVAVAAAFASLVLIGNLGWANQSYKNEWQLFKKPEQAVELYFTHHTLLPKRYTPGASATVDFTLVLHDTPKAEYRYEILQEGVTNSTLSMLNNGTVPMSDKSLEMEVPIVYSDSGSRSKISVRFPELNQSIYYWVEK